MKMRAIFPFAVSLGILLVLMTAYRTWMVPLLTSELWSNVTPEKRSYWRIRDEITAANERLRAIRVKDTVASVVPDTSGLFVVVPRTEPASAEYLRRIYMRDLPQDAKAAVGVMMVPFEFGGHPSFPDRMTGNSFVPGDTGGLPYCVVVISFFDRSLGSADIGSFRQHRGTGPCGWWARYGGPGPKIEQWLLAGGSRFTHVQRRYFGPYDELMKDGPASLFGRSNVRSGLSIPGQACLAGRIEACTAAVTDADTSSTLRVMGGDYFRPRLMSGEGVFLTDLERQFGAVRFAAFWQSQQDVEPAFEAAFGMSLGKWTHAWAKERAGPFSASPRMGLLTIVLAIVFVGLFVGIGVAVANRRAL